MRSLYNILFIFFFLLSSPYYFLKMWRRGNWRNGFGQRFGEYDSKVRQSLTNRHILWLHAVSVGEMNVCLQVIHALEPRMPNLKILVSTTTTTGMGELQKRLSPNITKIYYPVDRRKYVVNALAALHPHAIALVESEIWPNMIWEASTRGIPLFLLNARLSPRSYPRYLKLRFLFGRLFGAFAAVGAQNKDDAGRLRELGCHEEAVHVAGSLKFDAAVGAVKALASSQARCNVKEILALLGVKKDAPILVAGSTHAGEERLLAGMLPKLRSRFPGLFLILVPRHFERCAAVQEELKSIGLKFAVRSEVDLRTTTDPVDCLLVNTTGELMNFYESATVVFVGKSITAKGGQNPIEPAALGKPVVFGPNMQNFADVVEIFMKARAAAQVKNATELETVLAELFSNPERRAELGRNARQMVEANCGAVDRTVDMIVKHLAERDFYVAPKG